jgi:hypothetical protein
LFCLPHQITSDIHKIQKTHMKSRLTISIIGCTLLTLLTPTILLAELTDAEYLTRLGTSRRSQTCPSRSEPRTGRISVAQALKYTRCWFEDTNTSRGVQFADISNFKLSPPRQVTEKDSLQPWTVNKIDRTQPMYDIKARVVLYDCFPVIRDTSLNPNYFGAPGKNCSIHGSDTKYSLNGIGICFKELTEKWSCRLTVSGSGKKIYGPPPAN